MLSLGLRLVLDTDVIVAALRSPQGASSALLLALSEGKWTLLLSVALALEYEDVCGRPEHILAARLQERQIEDFVNTLIALAEPVDIHFRWRPALRDACDEMVLEAAVNGQAEGIVTFNARDFGPAPARFGIDLLSPSEALRRLRK